MKVIFAGSPEFATLPLETLIQSSHDVVAVYTQPDRLSGRGRKKVTATPVKALAEKHSIPVYQPETLKSSPDNPDELTVAQAELKALGADVMIVVGYGMIFPTVVLEMCHFGCLNIHVSLLPRWRGTSPVQRAIEAGDEETGVTIMQLNEGCDTGPILKQVPYKIKPDDTAGTVHMRLGELGSEALLQTLFELESGTLIPVPQDDAKATYAKKLSKADGKIDWSASAEVIERKIRAYNPWPICFCDYRGEALRIWQAELAGDVSASDQAPGSVVQVRADGVDVQTGDGVLRLKVLQLPGGKALPVKDFLNAKGQDFVTGLVLG